jgi:hypothetical protein
MSPRKECETLRGAIYVFRLVFFVPSGERYCTGGASGDDIETAGAAKNSELVLSSSKLDSEQLSRLRLEECALEDTIIDDPTLKKWLWLATEETGETKVREGDTTDWDGTVIETRRLPAVVVSKDVDAPASSMVMRSGLVF